MLGKELGHEVPVGQMQYNGDYKEMDQEDHCSLYLRGNGPRQCGENQVSWHNITNDSKLNTHVSNIFAKANRTLGFLRHNFAACPHMGTLKSRHTRDWCVHSWSVVE